MRISLQKWRVRSVSREYETLLLAALLHDVGKFYQKGKQGGVIDNSGAHPGVSRQFVEYFAPMFDPFVDVGLLKELVSRHHENENAFDREYLVQYAESEIKPLAYIVSMADNLSSSERDEPARERTTGFRTTPLASVFSGIRIGARENEIMHHRFAPLSPEGAFPVPGLKQTIESSNAEHIEAFTREVKTMELHNPADYNALLTVLESLLQKYTWCCPSSTYDAIADVSLYDHLRTTAAIAAALYRYHTDAGDMSVASVKDNEKRKFKLVVGDFSGIQNYIFSSAETGSKGMAKRLRARSFYINTLLTVVSMHILDAFGMPQCATLMSSGGKFYLLLPNTKASDRLIEEISESVNTFLYQEFQGDVCINLCSADLTGGDLMRFGDAVRELNAGLSEKKNIPFGSVLTREGEWDEDKFVLADDLKDKTLCTSCGKTLIGHDEENCARCQRDERLGAALVNAKYIEFTRGHGTFHMFGDIWISVMKKPRFNGGFMVHMLNATEFEDRKLYSLPVTARFAANHVPTENGGIKTFSGIAESAEGSKHLGILKADVDNLGFVFMEGFSRRYSVSRVSTLSRMLDLFFSGYVNALLEKEFPDVYSVFSGGDDLFLVGPWDKMPELALRINKDFRAYAAGNPCFTISAAVTLENAVSNVKTFAKTCEHRLKQAKTRSDETVYPERNGRDAVWFFGHFFSWGDFEKYIADGRTLEQWIDEGLANTSQLRRVAGYSGMYKDFLRKRTLDAARFDGLFAYDLHRNYSGDGPARIVRDWAAALRDNSLNYRNLRKDFYFAGFCVAYALNKTREKRGRDEHAGQ